jgi:CrcB protein
MKVLLLIFMGGGLGSVARYLVGRGVHLFWSQPYPLATWTANVAACFVLGLMAGWADQRQWMGPEARVFWTVGFCGGFSTFSTFSHESLTLLNTGLTGTLVAYWALSLVVCLLAVSAGLWVARL